MLPDDAVAMAYEAPSAHDPLRWHQTVAFCVPDAAAGRAAHTTVTELGRDTEALRPADLAGVLFDLGLGAPAPTCACGPIAGIAQADVAAAVREMCGPETVTLAADPRTRAAVAVALRRLAVTDGTTGTLASWRSRHGPDPALADPTTTDRPRG